MHPRGKLICPRLAALMLLLLCLTTACASGLQGLPTIDNLTDEEQIIACQQPKAPGLCRGRQLRYAYNTVTGNCESFYYTGCASTENNFMTYEECRRDCMRSLRY